MNTWMRKAVLGVACSGMLVSGVAMADNHMESSDDYMLEIMELGLKIGHWEEFGAAMSAYKECYSGKDGEGSWSVWADMRSPKVHIVSRFDKWAEMGQQDPAGEACWAEVKGQMTPHLTSMSVRFAKKMGDWSGESGDASVVTLHQFRVEDGSEFRAAAGAIVEVLKEGEGYSESWYDVIGNSSNEPSYFVVEHFADFAAMDADKPSAYERVKNAVGEEKADAMWERFGDSLKDDWDYFNLMLRRVDNMGYSPDGD